MPNLASLRADELNIDATTSETAPDHQPSRVSRLSQYAHWASVGLAAFTGLGSFAQMCKEPISLAIHSSLDPDSRPTYQHDEDLVKHIEYLQNLDSAPNPAWHVLLLAQHDDHTPEIKNFIAESEKLLSGPIKDVIQHSLPSQYHSLGSLCIYETPTHIIACFSYYFLGLQTNRFNFYLWKLLAPYSSQFMRAWRGASALLAAGLAYWLYRHPPQAPAKTAPQTASLSQSKKIIKALSGEYVDQQTQTRTGLGLMLTGAMIAVGSYFILPKCSNLLLTPLPQTMSLGAILSLRGIAIASNRS
jgi:hypothetical protein